MKHFYLLAALFILQSTFGQGLTGYYILENDMKVEGLFKEIDFLNPKEAVLFKKSTDADYSPLNLVAIKEYGINSEYKFVRYDVDIDVSATDLASITTVKEPVFQNKSLLLNIIAEGDASLYSYRSNEGTKYFYSVKSTNVYPTQLVYKKYRLQDYSVAENNTFRQQLYNSLQCNSINQNTFLNARYKTGDLKDIVESYNVCKGGAVAGTFKNSTGNSIKAKITVFAGLNLSKVSFSHISPEPDAITKSAPGFGAEMAALLPKGKWAIIVRANYEHFNGTGVSDQSYGGAPFVRSFKMNFSLINVDLGVRRYLAINKDNVFFADAFAGIAIPSGHVNLFTNYTTNVQTPTKTYALSSASFFGIGGGYTYKGRYGADIRYYTNRSLINVDGGIFGLQSTNIALNLRCTLN